MDVMTFIVEMSKAWAWPITIFILGYAAVSKSMKTVRR